MTVAWNVDDLKVSHKMLSAIQEFAEILNKEFGKETPITESYRRKLGLVAWNVIGLQHSWRSHYFYGGLH